MDRLHSIIVGSGPGGISAAITLKLRGKNIGEPLSFGKKK